MLNSEIACFYIGLGAYSVVLADMEMSIMVATSLLTFTFVRNSSRSAMDAITIPIAAGVYHAVSFLTSDAAV
jgi:hypothetical protein